jgi:hypothetical protein
MHKLSDIDIPGRELVLAVVPDFDFYAVRGARRVLLEFPNSSGIDAGSSITITLHGDVDGKRFELKLRSEGVRELVLPEMTPLFNIAELEILDLRDRQLEGIGFELSAQFDKSFRCRCNELVVLGFSFA